MSRSERDKGRRGEAEVAAIYRERGLEVRGLESGGDHLIVCDPSSGLVIHSEVKRQETARPWAWWEQAVRDAAPGAMPVVHFRRSRSPWLALVDALQLADLIASGPEGIGHVHAWLDPFGATRPDGEHVLVYACRGCEASRIEAG